MVSYWKINSSCNSTYGAIGENIFTVSTFSFHPLNLGNGTIASPPTGTTWHFRATPMQSALPIVSLGLWFITRVIVSPYRSVDALRSKTRHSDLTYDFFHFVR